MDAFPVGYARFIATLGLDVVPLAQVARIDGRTRNRATKWEGQIEVLTFKSKYAPKEGFSGDLQFALHYEGVNLQVLDALFERCGAAPLEEWLTRSPTSAYARRTGFLFEWLTQTSLNVPPSSKKMNWLPVLDEGLQFGLGETQELSPKFRIRNNLPGTRKFCPLVRKSEAIRKHLGQDLKARMCEILAKYPPDLLRRAAQYLYLKETRSTYEVERERPSANRTQRFLDLLKTAPSGKPLSQEDFVLAQNSILEPRFHEFVYRSSQNWLGGHSRYRDTVDFVPARPEDVVGLMQGLCEMSARGRAAALAGAAVDPVVHAAAIAFGFVFIHPFIDGNGRLHRYLLHEELSTLGFTPKSTVLPVSAFILSNLDLYGAVLNEFSKPVMARTDFTPPPPDVPATGNDPRFFRFFDATAQALFLYRALERTVRHDLEEEIHYLVSVERARAILKDEIDWPAQSLDLFINVVHQNNGTLSKTKRNSHFSWLTEEEQVRFVRAVNEAFSASPQAGAIAVAGQ
ncbi:MAG TPA: Fic family protein [Steroidobacteraceae bacterium]|nr:Fic family protein [Steroidobacteraceae bacterium]